MKKEATTAAKLTRRGFVTAAGALGALGLAGCAPQAAEKMADTGAMLRPNRPPASRRPGTAWPTK